MTREEEVTVPTVMVPQLAHVTVIPVPKLVPVKVKLFAVEYNPPAGVTAEDTVIGL